MQHATCKAVCLEHPDTCHAAHTGDAACGGQWRPHLPAHWGCWPGRGTYPPRAFGAVVFGTYSRKGFQVRNTTAPAARTCQDEGSQMKVEGSR